MVHAKQSDPLLLWWLRLSNWHHPPQSCPNHRFIPGLSWHPGQCCVPCLHVSGLLPSIGHHSHWPNSSVPAAPFNPTLHSEVKVVTPTSQSDPHHACTPLPSTSHTLYSFTSFTRINFRLLHESPWSSQNRRVNVFPVSTVPPATWHVHDIRALPIQPALTARAFPCNIPILQRGIGY